MSDKFRPSRKHLLLAVLVIALVGGGAGIYLEFFRTYHFAVVQDHVLYRDGAHSITEFRNALRKVEPATVVSLNDADEIADPDKPQFREEEALLSERKINLVRIPVKLGGWPTSADIKSFIATVSLTRNRPTLVHCAQGVRRTGMFVAAWQMTVEHLSRDQAKAAILTFGHSQATVNDIRRFIDAYDADRQELSGLPGTTRSE